MLLDGAAQKLYLAGAAAFLATLAASLSASSISFIISRFSDMLSYAMYFLPARSYTHGTRKGGSAAVRCKQCIGTSSAARARTSKVNWQIRRTADEGDTDGHLAVLADGQGVQKGLQHATLGHRTVADQAPRSSRDCDCELQSQVLSEVKH